MKVLKWRSGRPVRRLLAATRSSSVLISAPGRRQGRVDEGGSQSSFCGQLRRDECKAKYLYEKIYCARGEMENRIKECQLDLYADRTSAATMRANQLRLWFASMAYLITHKVQPISGADRAWEWFGRRPM
jgi:hypothetical protein